MKVGDLIRFTKTGVMGIVVDVVDAKKNHEVPNPVQGPHALVYHTWEDEETGSQQSDRLWYYVGYLLECTEPATFGHSGMGRGVL